MIARVTLFLALFLASSWPGMTPVSGVDGPKNARFLPRI
jgi:hypothetical protein